MTQIVPNRVSEQQWQDGVWVDRPARVLLIYEEGPQRTQLATDLRASGYEVVELSDGLDLENTLDEAMDSGDGWNAFPDLVVSDAPVLGDLGLQLLERICDLAPKTRVILLAEDEEKDALRRRLDFLQAVCVLGRDSGSDDIFGAAKRLCAEV